MNLKITEKYFLKVLQKLEGFLEATGCRIKIPVSGGG